MSPDGRNGVKLNRDTVMGAILIAAGVVTYLYTQRKRSITRRVLALLGAAATVIIGALLFFHIA